MSCSTRGPLPWNATALGGDVAAAVARLKAESGGDIEVYGKPLRLAGTSTLDSGVVSLTYVPAGRD